jgi:hypothetical protein
MLAVAQVAAMPWLLTDYTLTDVVLMPVYPYGCGVDASLIVGNGNPNYLNNYSYDCYSDDTAITVKGQLTEEVVGTTGS